MQGLLKMQIERDVQNNSVIFFDMYHSYKPHCPFLGFSTITLCPTEVL